MDQTLAKKSKSATSVLCKFVLVTSSIDESASDEKSKKTNKKSTGTALWR
jgi:hypothetical protein